MTETLIANREERTVKGMLLPYGELSRNSNIGKIQFDKGSLTLPADPDVVSANVRHNREDPRARAIELEDTEAGVVATFRIAKTPEGDELLTDIEEGRLTRLSAEVKGITRQGTKALTGALFGAAFVDEGAFATAALYAELAEEEATETAQALEDASTDPNTVGQALTPEEAAALRDLLSKLSAPAEETPEADESASFSKETPMTEQVASVPETLLAGAQTTTEVPTHESKYAVANAYAAYFSTKDRSALEALSPETRNSGEMMFAALNDIKSNYAGSVGVNIIQPQWLGDVWGSRGYERKYTPLVTNSALTSLEVKGYKYTTDASGDTWTGDKTAIPSSTPATTAVSTTAIRWAGGHDIAREFLDFQGQYPSFWDNHFTQMANSYARKTDTYLVDFIEAGASTLTAGAVPSGANAATVLIVDGALKVLEADATPSYAIVAPDVYRSLLLQGKDDIIATLSLSMGLESGDLAGFKIIPSSAVATGKAIVGSKDAVTFFELPGAPIRTEAQDIAKGGIDHAFFGYYVALINNSAAVVKVTGA